MTFYRTLPLFTVFMLISCVATAQEKQSLNTLQPAGVYENISSQKLGGDSLATGFMIWIKKEVKAHKHLKHAETIFLLEGTGVMKIGEKEVEVQSGDYLFIPKGVVHSLKVTSEMPVKVLSIQAPEFLGDDRVFVE